MIYGLLSGILWALDTVLLGYVLSITPFISTNEAIFVAPFVSTFLHDIFSSFWMIIYMSFTGLLIKTIKLMKTKSGMYIMLGSILGGPLGMSGYILSIKYIGPSYTAIISSVYPAIGALLSYIFLKEKIKLTSIIGLIISILAIMIFGYVPGEEIRNLPLGFIFAILCVMGWATEGVICALAMKENYISPEQSLQIRQLTSAIFYGFLIIPLIKGVKFALIVISTKASIPIGVAALVGTISYIFYYKSIRKIGATKAMALNITYSAWSIFLGLILLHNDINLKSIICCIVIIIGSIMASDGLK